jgi:hypothetical protein
VGLDQGGGEAAKIMDSVYEIELDRQLFLRLRDNEIDLQTELSDLAEEIISREARLVEVQGQLRRTREHMRRLLTETEVGAGAC